MGETKQMWERRAEEMRVLRCAEMNKARAAAWGDQTDCVRWHVSMAQLASTHRRLFLRAARAIR